MAELPTASSSGAGGGGAAAAAGGGGAGGAGGVRNIRAMFEAKADSSPPSRGRSPAGSEGFGARSDSSRPISKVRTSFVSVDGKSGQLATQFGSLRRKDSDTLVSESGDLLAPKTDPRPSSNDSRAGRTSSLARVREEEGAMANNDGAPADIGTVLKGSPFESNDGAKVTANAAQGTPGTSTSGKPSGVKAAVRAVGDKASELKAKVESKAPGAKPAPISTKTTTKAGSGPQSAKSTSSKTPTTPKASLSRPSLGKQPVAAAAKSLPSRTARLSTASTKDDGKPAKSSASTRPPVAAKASASTPKVTGGSNSANSSPGSFVKPPPRSPTRPVKLPAGAMATTTASSAKLSRTSLDGANRTSGAGVGGLISGRSSRAGSAKTSRSSLAPQSSSTKAADEGLISRMMRPTQSSASKTHEKEADSSTRKATAPKPTVVSTHPAVKPPISKPKTAASKAPEPRTAKPAATAVKPAIARAMGAKAAVTKVSESKTKSTNANAPAPSKLEANAAEEPVAEPPLAPETKEAIDPGQAAEPEIAGEVTQNPTEPDSAAATTSKPENAAIPIPVAEVNPEPPLAPETKEAIAGVEQTLDTTSLSIATDQSIPQPAKAPPEEAVQEALAEAPPVPTLPAPTDAEAKANAAELEMEANEAVQIDSAAPAPAPLLEESPEALRPTSSSRSRPSAGQRMSLNRSLSSDMRLPEASIPAAPTEEEIEELRRQSVAAGEQDEVDTAPSAIPSVDDELD